MFIHVYFYVSSFLFPFHLILTLFCLPLLSLFVSLSLLSRYLFPASHFLCCLSSAKLTLTSDVVVVQGPPGLPGLKGDPGSKGEKVSVDLSSLSFNQVPHRLKDTPENSDWNLWTLTLSLLSIAHSLCYITHLMKLPSRVNTNAGLC